MRKIYITLLIAILCGGCTSRRPADGEPLYVSILPLRSLVQGIVGDDFDIEVLVPPGASPETYARHRPACLDIAPGIAEDGGKRL